MTVSNYQVIDILKMSTDYLEKKGIENPRLNVELLLGHVLKMNRVQLYLNFERPLTTAELDQFRQLLKRRGNHEPIQYITGETEFYSLKFKVNRHTLIPRPETEVLVETAIEHCTKNLNHLEIIKILDIGTGSGNIAIALAKNIERAQVTAIDVQDESLRIARQNAEYHQTNDKINFVKQDILAENIEFDGIFNLIVSNPPYISREEFEQLPREVKQYEPYAALDGGKEGMKFHNKLAELSRQLLVPGGIIAVEIGAFQADQVYQVFLDTHLFQQIEIINDLNDLPRVLLAKK